MPNNSKKQPTINYGKYGAMAFQMAAIIGIGTYGGMKLDEWFEFKKIPVFTLILALVSAGGAIYLFIKDALKK